MTLRHDVKTLLGDSWASPRWAVVLPGGVAVDLTDGWEVTASVRKRRGGPVIRTYSRSNNGVRLGGATVTLNNGTSITTSTVQLRHEGADTSEWPAFVGPWDCQISRSGQTYTIASGTFRTVGDVT